MVIMITMSYKVEQKVGNNIYVYEATNYWDKDKKQSRQKRVYLGRKNLETGELIPTKKQSTPKSVRDCGESILINNIFSELNLSSLLSKHFGKDAESIKSFVTYSLTERKPSYLYPTWASSSINPSRFIQSIGEQEYERESFIHDWIKTIDPRNGIYFDITSFSSYSKKLEPVEWGYNRDGEKLPQINYGMICSGSTPLFYELYPGSISDVSTLTNVVKRLNSYKVKKVSFIMDRGFYSKENLKFIIHKKYDCIIPLPFSTKISKLLISKHKDISNVKNLVYFKEKKPLYYLEDHIKIGGNNFYTHIYFDEERKNNELAILLSKLLNIEKIFNKKQFKNKAEAQEYINNKVVYKKLLTLKKNGSTYVIENNLDELNKEIFFMGKIILLSSKKIPKTKSVLEMYLEKDSIEKIFNNIKNGIFEDRLKVSNLDSLYGKMFLNFITLIIYNKILEVTKSRSETKKLTVNEVLLELKKLKEITMLNGKKYLSEITKKQKIIFKTFKIDLKSHGY